MLISRNQVHVKCYFVNMLAHEHLRHLHKMESNVKCPGLCKALFSFWAEQISLVDKTNELHTHLRKQGPMLKFSVVAKGQELGVQVNSFKL